MGTVNDRAPTRPAGRPGPDDIRRKAEILEAAGKVETAAIMRQVADELEAEAAGPVPGSPGAAEPWSGLAGGVGA